MGVDLRLVPLYIDHNGITVCEFVTLELDRCRELWARIGDRLEVHPFEQDLWHYHDEGGVRTREDSYGSPLTWASAGDVAALLDEWIAEQAQLPMSTVQQWTRAAAAYCKALDSDTRVVLWWH